MANRHSKDKFKEYEWTPPFIPNKKKLVIEEIDDDNMICANPWIKQKPRPQIQAQSIIH